MHTQPVQCSCVAAAKIERGRRCCLHTFVHVFWNKDVAELVVWGYVKAVVPAEQVQVVEETKKAVADTKNAALVRKDLLPRGEV